MKLTTVLTVTIVVGLIILSSTSQASKPIKIGSGTEGKNYHGMINDVIDYCAAETGRPLENRPSPGGSTQNILDMSNKLLHAGLTQIDVLKFQARIMGEKVNQNRMKVIIGAHRESGHLVIPPNWQPSSESMWGNILSTMGMGDEKKGISIDLIKNQSVGGWGGSLVSIRALSSFMKLGLQAVEIKPGQQVKHPIMIVGGQPDKHVQAYLNAGWKLVPINAESLKARASFYDAVSLNYSIKGKLTSVPSFGVRAVLIGKSSRSAKRNKPFSNLATCLRRNLADLADDSDTNPNWESVYEFENDGQVNWQYFPLNEDTEL